MCQKGFNEKHVFKKLSKTKNGKYLCTKCNRLFSTSGIRYHMELHTGKFSFYCEICRKGFNSGSYFKAHMRARQGLKHHCEYCSKPFMDKQKLKYHLPVHTGQHRFRCEMCQKGFNEKHVFKKLSKSHNSDTSK